MHKIAHLPIMQHIRKKSRGYTGQPPFSRGFKKLTVALHKFFHFLRPLDTFFARCLVIYPTP